MYRIVVIGPQGSGKGTQAELLAERLGVSQVQPGVMYRKEVAAGTELGKRAALFLVRGDIVPDDITNALVAARLREPDCAGGFILDGYPRTMVQLAALDRFSLPLTNVILLEITDDEAVRRLTRRLVCVCGKPYTGREFPVEDGEESRCGACNGKLFRRSDDTPEAIRRRLAIYHSETNRVVAEYDRRGALVRIDGMRSIDEVHRDILAKLEIT